MRARARARQSWRGLIDAPVAEPKVIAVFSPRGGVGKTTTALNLGHALAMVRGDLVVALDANPDSGNLVKRVAEPHCRLGAGDLHRAAARITSCTDLLPYVTETDSGLWVVRSDVAPGSRLGAGEYRRILPCLSRYAPVVVVDLGTGLREQAFLAISDAADALVAVTSPAAEAADSAVDALDWISQRTDTDQACTVVVNAAAPRPPGLDVGELVTASQFYVDQVLQVPRDAHLSTGGVCRWPLLAARTQDAYLRLAAAIMTLLGGPPAREITPLERTAS